MAARARVLRETAGLRDLPARGPGRCGGEATRPNTEEIALTRRSAQGEIVAFGSTPGERIRREVREANRQLKKATGGNLPALVVIFNNTDCSLHTDPYAVMTAMQGIDTIQVTVPPNLTESPTIGPTVSGRERGMRPDVNTTLSGIAVLRGNNPDNVHVAVFHNRFARCPLDWGTLRLPRTRQFRIPKDANNSLVAWEEV